MFHRKEEDDDYKQAKPYKVLQGQSIVFSFAKCWPMLRSIGAEGANTSAVIPAQK